MLSNPAVQDALLRSLQLSAAVALASGILGCAMAWLVTRTDVPGARALRGLLSVPYALPAYLLAMAWVVLANPAVGLLREFLPFENGIYGFWGMVFVETLVAFAFPYLELRAGFERMDPSLEEAARMSGASPARVFRDVSFPLLWPSLFNGMGLAFLYTLSSFGVPAILGAPVRQFVLTTLIYSQIKLGGAAGIVMGLKLSLLLLAAAVFVLGISFWLSHLQRKKSGAISGAKSARPSLVGLGAARIPAALLTWGFFAVAVLLPWIALGMSALAPVAGNFSPSEWTLRNLKTVLSLAEFKQALVNSLMLASLVATIVVSLGFFLGFFAVRRGSKRALVFIEALGVPFATPGTLIAILIVFASTWLSIHLGDFDIDLDSPLFWMAVAYGVKYAAVGARMMLEAYRQVHPALEEAARMSGARTWALLRTIWFPLLKQALVAAWLLSALPMATELTMSVLLTGPGASTLGTVLFQLQEYADQPSAAALAWILMTAALLISLKNVWRTTDG
jgi:iron(III) transport system permease protein